MRKITFIIIVFIVAACNNQMGPEEVRKEVASKKKEISELEKEISNLEAKFEKDTVEKVPVRVKNIKYEAFDHYIEVNGSAEMMQQAIISPETNGQIKTIHVEEGERVKKGELLVNLKTEVTQNSIEEVKTSLELARITFRKQKELWQDSIGSEIQYLEAKNRMESLERRMETLKSQLDMAKIEAPFDGIIENVILKEGELASPGARVIELVNLDKIKIVADVSEEYLSAIREGDKVTVEFPAYPGFKREIPIGFVGNVINPENRTFSIQLKMDNSNEMIKPNIISVLHINDYSNDSAMIVPSIILKRDIKGFFVFIARKTNGSLKAKKVYVENGESYQNKTEILSGIEPGDKVITEGYNKVTTGTEVEIVN
ncbi:MAG: efflux RND transporter periplasmic adaptor subunit [Bacteroidales bacterium]|nr:efflux RND transporter periplasmic adaptor subunit [Bacteroidales bacterium]